MPRYEQTILLNGMDTETALALAYEALKNLQWEIVLAGQDTLLGHTLKSWKSKGQQVRCTVTYQTLSVTSETVSGDLPNMSVVHNNNTVAFLEAFELAKASVTEDTLSANLHAIHDLRNVTQHAMAQKQAAFEELDKAMNLTGSNLYATYAIIGINVLVFLLMAIDGAGLFEPNGLVHLRWGSNFAPLTLSGDWWRLITNTFIHFGAIHIVMNMYCLYSVATYLEPMLGKQKYLAAYLCSGVLASLVSLWWHTEPSNSAGASGAVFGLYGLFLAFLTTSFIPSSVRQSLLRSIGIFVLFNLAFGMKSGVDNAAHVGGLISGFIIGYVYVFIIKKEKQQGQKIVWLAPIIIAVTIAITATYIQQHTVENTKRTTLLSDLKESGYADYEKFTRQLGEFDQIHASAMEIMTATSLTGTKRADQITYELLPKWDRATQLITATNSFDISPKAHNKASKILTYIGLRQKESVLLKQIAVTQPSLEMQTQENELREQADDLIKEIVKR